MKLMVSGHRREKLTSYNEVILRILIDDVVEELIAERGLVLGMSGMASGVDLWFCESLLSNDIPYWACVPFDPEEQAQYMVQADRVVRARLMDAAVELKRVRNRFMVEECDAALVVWDGNKGGTHNCFQQLIEKKKDIWWLNPVKEKVVLV